MGARSKEPTPGRKTGAALWEYEAPPNGKSYVGWLAGPYFGLDTHHAGGTKPCRFGMTDGKMSCPFCDSRQVPVWRAYVPYYSKDYQRRFVVVNEDYLPLLKEAKVGDQIRISRAESSRAGCSVESSVWRTAPLHESLLATMPVAILPALWRVWKDQELLEWHQREEAASCLPTVVVKPAVIPAAELPAARDRGAGELKAIANRIRGKITAKELASGIGGMPDDVPHANGKPKPK